MANKIEPENSDEYTYSEDQPVEAYPLKSPGIMANTMNFFSRKVAQHKGLLTAIGIFLVLYIVFKIVTLVEHKTPVSHMQPVKQRPISHLPQINRNIPPPITQQQPQDISTSNVQSQGNIATLDQKLYNVQQSLGNIDSSLQRVEAIMSQQLQMQQQRENQRLQALRRKAGAFYHVQSVIPNRAWLTTARGQTLTVTIGTYIPGAGTVVAIDSIKGTVITNNGVTIQYSLTDQ